MNYPTLKIEAPSLKRVTLLACTALILFTAVAGLVGSDRAFAGTARKAKEPYAIKIVATRSGESITLQGTVSENKNQQVVSAPALTFATGQRASTRTSAQGLEVRFEVRPDGVDRIAVDVTIEKDGEPIQTSTLQVVPTDSETMNSSRRYTGAPITLNLKDAGLRDVIATFGRISGLEMHVDPAIQGTVTVSWHNVPWDEAFDSLLKENDLMYRLDGGTIHVSRK